MISSVRCEGHATRAESRAFVRKRGVERCTRGAAADPFRVRGDVPEGRDGCGRSPYCRCWRRCSQRVAVTRPPADPPSTGTTSRTTPVRSRRRRTGAARRRAAATRSATTNFRVQRTASASNSSADSPPRTTRSTSWAWTSPGRRSSPRRAGSGNGRGRRSRRPSRAPCAYRCRPRRGRASCTRSRTTPTPSSCGTARTWCPRHPGPGPRCWT